MDTAVYYIFSTIAQTLGSVLGLLAAVLLVHLQVLNNSLSDAARFLLKQYETSEKYKTGHPILSEALTIGSFGELLDLVSEHEPEEFIDPKAFQAARKILEVNQKYRQHILGTFVLAVSLTMVTIVICLVCMLFGPKMTGASLESMNAAYILSALGILLCLACFFLYARLISIVLSVDLKREYTSLFSFKKK
jgi:hypothetical protein